MNQPQTTCDPKLIAQCLDDSLDAVQRAAFEAHLERCAKCRESLEGHAASATDWQSAREFLSSHACHEDRRPGEEQDRDSHEGHAVPMIDSVLAALAPTDDPRMLGRLGTYEIAGVVGSGGMGVVLKGFDPALNRFVAIKLLAPHLAVSSAARQRFAREARSAASVVHENVVAIHAVSDGGPLPYFVMPYLRGASLQKRLDAHGRLSAAEVLRVAMQIAAGLAAAHAQGLVHRDIKPANILLEDGVERLKITDFGLARAADDASLTRTGVIAGTPQFMSPEQARGEAIDGRSDLFSLASLMYAMCTGRPPFRAETSYGILHRISNDQPRPVREINAAIPEWLEQLIGKLHAKHPAHRFQTAQEVAQVIEQCLAHVQQPLAVLLPSSVAELSGRNRRLSSWRRRFAIATSGLASIAAIFVAGLFWLGRSPPEAKRPTDKPRPASPSVTEITDNHAGSGDASESMQWHDEIHRQLAEAQAAVDQFEGHEPASSDASPTDDVRGQLQELHGEIQQLENQAASTWSLNPSLIERSENSTPESNP